MQHGRKSVLHFFFMFAVRKLIRKQRIRPSKKEGFIFEKRRTCFLDQGAMARHHEGLKKSFTDEQNETFEKTHDCWSEYMSLAEAAIFEYAFKQGTNIAS